MVLLNVRVIAFLSYPRDLFLSAGNTIFAPVITDS